MSKNLSDSKAVSSDPDERIEHMRSEFNIYRILIIISLLISVAALMYIVFKWNDYKDEIYKPVWHIRSDFQMLQRVLSQKSPSSILSRRYNQNVIYRIPVQKYNAADLSDKSDTKEILDGVNTNGFDLYAERTFSLEFGKYHVQGYCTISCFKKLELDVDLKGHACVGIVNSLHELQETLLEGPIYDMTKANGSHPFLLNGILQLFGSKSYSIGIFINIEGNISTEVFDKISSCISYSEMHDFPNCSLIFNRIQ